MFGFKQLSAPAAQISIKIPPGFRHFMLLGLIRTTHVSLISDYSLLMYVNDDFTDANYRTDLHRHGPSHAVSEQAQPLLGWLTHSNTDSSNTFGGFWVEFDFYTMAGVRHRKFTSRLARETNVVSHFDTWQDSTGWWSGTDPVEKVILRPNDYPANNFETGCIIEGWGVF
jgi:hypothetical protein